LETLRNGYTLRRTGGLTQQSIADLIAMHRSNYSRVETGDRDLSIEAIDKIAKYFNMTIDQLVNFEGDIPQEVTIEDKALIEQVKLIQELEPEEKRDHVKSMGRSLKFGKKTNGFFNNLFIFT
jgi:transcriptional regulator with XRE-family HTH domain